MLPSIFRREARVLLVAVVLASVAELGFAAVPHAWRAAAGAEHGPEEGARHVEAALDQPSLGTVVDRLTRYVADYGERLSVIVGIERYEQHVLETNERRSLVSEIAIMPAGRDWVAYRDVFEVDGRRVAQRTDRLQRLILDSPATAFEQARRIADESARFNLGGIQRNFNTPTMCLFSLRAENRRRFKFKKAETRTADGKAEWKIRFEEKERPTIVRSPEGRSLPMTGYVWLRPDTGEVHRTDMEIDGDVHASVTVEFEADARLQMMVPARMQEVYRGRTRGDGVRSTVECEARYSDFKRFATSGRVVVPK